MMREQQAPFCEQCAGVACQVLMDTGKLSLLGSGTQLPLLVDGHAPVLAHVCFADGGETLHREDFVMQLYRTILRNQPEEIIVLSHLSRMESHPDADVARYHLCTQFPWSAFVSEQQRVCAQVGLPVQCGYLTQENGEYCSFAVSVGSVAYQMRYYFVADTSDRLSSPRATWLAQGLTATTILWHAVAMYAVLVPDDQEFPHLPSLREFARSDQADQEACPVCFEMTTHKLVQCGHTICRACSNRILAGSTRTDPLENDIVCPMCRTSSVCVE